MRKKFYCKNCKMILDKEGPRGMKRRGFKPRDDLIKTKANYPHGRKSKPVIRSLYCKNCGSSKILHKKVL